MLYSFQSNHVFIWNAWKKKKKLFMWLFAFNGLLCECHDFSQRVSHGIFLQSHCRSISRLYFCLYICFEVLFLCLSVFTSVLKFSSSVFLSLHLFFASLFLFLVMCFCHKTFFNFVHLSLFSKCLSFVCFLCSIQVTCQWSCKDI